MNSALNIAIVGAGFAGLASATLLARAGHRVTVFEKFRQPQAVGAGILIQPTGLAAMRTLGIAEEVLAHGAKIDHLWGVNPQGQRVIDIDYARWQPGSYGLGLHRGVLFTALWNAASDAGVAMRTGHEVHTLAELDAFDVRVIADGANSQLRAQTGLRAKNAIYPWGAVWAVLPDPTRHYGATLWQWYRQANQMLGIMPTGLQPGGDTPVVSLFWSVRADRYAALQVDGLARWKETVLQLNPACEALLDHISDPQQLTWARYHDVVMPKYHTTNTVVIGDAAHATSPQLGQGTNLALLDAVALARCLAQPQPVPEALANYTAQRRGHLHFYSQASRLLTPLFQSDQVALPWLRDRFMAHSARWPVMQGMNLQTLVGVRRTWWGGELKLDTTSGDNAA
ncbi:MAG: FAD-binding monooxygenase [Burkholderiales bacterium PBB3]|nr:MAG: FAD-binding monooxygenase [Burkholderiales bacterium PBB3]